MLLNCLAKICQFTVGLFRTFLYCPKIQKKSTPRSDKCSESKSDYFGLRNTVICRAGSHKCCRNEKLLNFYGNFILLTNYLYCKCGRITISDLFLPHLISCVRPSHLQRSKFVLSIGRYILSSYHTGFFGN